MWTEKADKTNCQKTIIKALNGGMINTCSNKQMKHDRTPLHWSIIIREAT